MLTGAQIAVRLGLLASLAVGLGYGMARLGHPNSQWFYCTMLRLC